MKSKGHSISEDTNHLIAGATDFFLETRILTIQPDIFGRTNNTWTVHSLYNHCYFPMPYQHLSKKTQQLKT